MLYIDRRRAHSIRHDISHLRVMKAKGDWAEGDLRSRRVGEVDLAAAWSHFSSLETAKKCWYKDIKRSDHERSSFTNFETGFINTTEF
jgi:hypothetical protein